MPDTDTLEQPTQEMSMTDIAALMGKHGAFNDGKTPDSSIPDIKPEQQQSNQEPPKQGETPAKTEQKVEAPVQSQKPAETPAAVAPPKQETPPPTAPDWKEVLKQQPDTEVLKALGYDDKWIGFLNHMKSGGSPDEYLTNMSTDYTKMSPEDVMRRQLRAENPELSNEDFEEYFKAEVIERYKIDPDQFSENDVKRGRINITVAAKKARAELIANQEKYLLKAPETRQSPEVTEYLKQKEETTKNLQAYNKFLQDDPVIKDVQQNKRITIGEGAEAFNYEVDSPQDLVDLLVDGKKYAAATTTPAGTPDTKNLTIYAAMLLNPKKFWSELGAHFKKLGTGSLVNQLENASDTVGTPAKGTPANDDPAAALAKGGVLTGGR